MKAAVFLATAVMTGLGGCTTGMTLMRGRPLVAAANVCTERRLPVYFDEGTAGLTAPARQLLTATTRELRGCDIRRVQVVGLASATGDSAANQALSAARAQNVTRALARRGWPTPVIEAVAVGDAGAVTAQGAMEPMRRRAEVVISAAPKS